MVDADVPANSQVRTLVHEITHALGVDYANYSRAQAEVIADTSTLVVLSGVGLDVSGETIPYVAGWGETGALTAGGASRKPLVRVVDAPGARHHAGALSARPVQQIRH